MFDKFEQVSQPAERRRLHCNECERTTIHTLEAQSRGTWSDPNDHVSGGADFSIFRCGACDSVCYETASWNSESYYHDDDGDLIPEIDRVQYPVPVGKDFTFDRTYTPASLDSLLDDVLHSYGGGRNTLATVGLRMVVEHLTNQAECTGRNLQKKIEALKSKGLLDDDQHDLFQTIREMGNASAHAARPMSQDELIAGMEVINLLIEKLYTNPGKARTAVAQGKKILRRQAD